MNGYQFCSFSIRLGYVLVRLIRITATVLIFSIWTRLPFGSFYLVKGHHYAFCVQVRVVHLK